MINFPEIKKDIYKHFKINPKIMYDTLDGKFWLIKKGEFEDPKLTDDQIKVALLVRELNLLCRKK